MVSNPGFRRAQISDLPDIIALLADDELGASREDPGLPVNPLYQQAFAAIDGDPNQMLAVVAECDAVVGCLQLSFIPGLSRTGLMRGQIESVRIAASHRGTGLGRAMLAWAIEQCRDRGCGLVQLSTDTSRSDALRFYESMGFQASHHGLKLTLPREN